VSQAIMIAWPGRIMIRPAEPRTRGSDPKTAPYLTNLNKNRLHIDLDPDDPDAEAERILALGARRADVGQGADVSWVVLADPEDNEFCVLKPHRSLVN
jgi:hypothetical protein